MKSVSRLEAEFVRSLSLVEEANQITLEALPRHFLRFESFMAADMFTFDVKTPTVNVKMYQQITGKNRRN